MIEYDNHDQIPTFLLRSSHSGWKFIEGRHRRQIGRDGLPKPRAAQGSEVWIKTGAVMSGGSMTANHIEHEIATFPRITGCTAPGPAIAYSRVGTGRTPSAVPSSSNFPASRLGSELGLIAQSCRAFSSPPRGRPTRLHVRPPGPPTSGSGSCG
jgi:hypothetical protein